MTAQSHTGHGLARLAASIADISRYASLRDQPAHECAEGWVVTRPADVAAALASAALTVTLPDPPRGAAGRLQARMARFSDGAFHRHRRALVEALLPDAASVEWGAWSITSAALAGRRGQWDAMDLARRVPVAVLAAALGVAPEAADCVVALTGELCAALAPRTGSDPETDGDAVATALLAALGGTDRPGVADRPGITDQPGVTDGPGAADRPGGADRLGGYDEERAIAVASILFQARDATAGLIGLALSAAASPLRATAADLVSQALHADPPVQCTRRTAAMPVTIGGVRIPVGAPVWILLVTADRGEPWPAATFGGGPHACPGRLAAAALARGVVGAILGGGWRPVPGQAPGYEPRLNLRIPVSVLMERA
jgi:cytochrome P450